MSGEFGGRNIPLSRAFGSDCGDQTLCEDHIENRWKEPPNFFGQSNESCIDESPIDVYHAFHHIVSFILLCFFEAGDRKDVPNKRRNEYNFRKMGLKH